MKLACKFVVQVMTAASSLQASDVKRHVDTNWTRNDGHENVLTASSLLGRVSFQNDVLLLQRVRPSDSSNYSCKIRHRTSRTEDEVHYQLLVLGKFMNAAKGQIQ